jgi:hypothetical protein
MWKIYNDQLGVVLQLFLKLPDVKMPTPVLFGLPFRYLAAYRTSHLV